MLLFVGAVTLACADPGSLFPQTWVDGGLTDSLPILPVGRTVTISPFSGRPDISPQDKGQLDLYVNLANQDVTVSPRHHYICR